MTADEIYEDLKFIENFKYIHIEDRSQFLTVQPRYHPSTRQYKEFKIQEIENCIYGKWGKQGDSWRWLPGMTYLYCNYIKIEMENDNKETIIRLASLDDVEWLIGYAFAACYGFTSFEKEEEFSCDKALIDPYEMILAKRHPERLKHLYKPNGELRTYITVEDYLYNTHNINKGKPQWFNEAEDLMIFGARASGKTFSIIGLCCWLLLFDGTKSISKDWINLKISANIIAGAAGDLPLQEINRRIEVALNCLLTDEDLGVYHIPNVESIPLLGRTFLGQTNNFFRYKYIVNGRESGGSGSSYRPVSYAPNKKGSTTSAASTRVALSIVDECGRMPVSIKSIHGSNSALCRRNTKFGVQLMAGTSSSDLELVQEAKEMFTNPSSYNMHSFYNPFTKEAPIRTGLYLPAILVQRNFKDENGNTLVRDVLKYFANRRAKCETPDALREEQLNSPILVEEMWYARKGSFFNKESAKKRFQQLLLLKNQGKEEQFRRFVNLSWNNGKVEVEFINPKQAITIDNFFESQGSNESKNKKGDTDTDIIIYEEPEYGKDDLYLVSCDTYVSDEKNLGKSLGSVYVYKNPKYIIEGKTGNIIVAEYTGKPDSRDRFYEKVELLIAYYGNPKRCLMFEGNRGYDKLTEFFIKKKKEWLLAFTPTNYDGKAKVSFVLKYGYLIGQNKPELLTFLAEWLQEATTLNIDGIKLNVERISSLGFLSEIIHYDYEDDKGKKSNYDRIMSMLGIMVAKRNVFNQYEEKHVKTDDNIYTAFKNRKMKTKYKLKNKWITS